ncbi:MAG TPA: diguanylate cyclase [Steroidobacteraceae bacterium]|nr:diguanylate cyclase [Steroidobacteraceae bacterium]
MMRFTLVPSDAQDTAAARELDTGFPKLEFGEPLEAEFRRTHRQKLLPWTRAGFAALGLLALILWVLDHWQLPADFAPHSYALRLFVMLPLALLGLGMTYVMARNDALVRWSTLIFAGFSLAAIALDTLLARAGGPLAFSGVSAALLIGCSVMGLRFWPALDVCGALVVGAVGAVMFAGWGATQVIPYALTLLTVVTIGCAVAYALEHAIRVAYLEAVVIAHLGERDGLTGLFNRRVFDRYLERVWQQSIVDKSLAVLMLVDADNFRSYNDRFGLKAGDDCIRQIAAAMAGCARRPLDFCARYSGIQFAIVLANPDRLYAEDIPQHVRAAVAALGIAHPDSPNGRHVTVSVGVALTVPRVSDSREAFIELAQAALREAHDDGGDRVVARESESSLVQTGMFRAEVALAAARGR